MKNGKLRNWDRLYNQSAAHDVFNYLRVPDKEWNSKWITVSNIDDNLHVKAHKQSVCCTILLLTLKSSQAAGTEYNWCAALQTLSRLGCSDFLTWNSNSRGCFWWWKRPWTWKTPFRRYNGTHLPTQTLGAEAGRDLHRHSRVEDSRQIYQNGSFVASTDSLHLNSLQLHILDFTSLLARCSILLRWKSPDPTSSSLCFIDFFFFWKKKR